jgi:hypothetical protein
MFSNGNSSCGGNLSRDAFTGNKPQFSNYGESSIVHSAETCLIAAIPSKHPRGRSMSNEFEEDRGNGSWQFQIGHTDDYLDLRDRTI